MKKSAPIRISLLLIIILCLSACRESILQGLSEIEANRVMVSLHRSGLKSQKEKLADGSWNVTVEKNESIKAFQTLNSLGLLRNNPPAYDSGNSVLMSRSDQKMVFERKLSTELEYTLRSFANVIDARVHLNLPDKDPVFGQILKTDNKSSASVLLLVEEQKPDIETDIKQLVSGASGIPAEDIKVLSSVNEIKISNFATNVSSANLEESTSTFGFLSEDVKQIIIYSVWLVVVAYALILLRGIFSRRKLKSLEGMLNKEPDESTA